MPRTKFQEFIFTIFMVIIMVYAMICYNVAIETGGMSYSVFVYALPEMLFMCPLAFVFDFFVVSHLAKKLTFKKFNPQKDNPFFLVLSISAISVLFMCPYMSLMATLIIKKAGVQFLPVWIQTTILNFPMALLWQLFVAGPIVRGIFSRLFKKQLANNMPNPKNNASQKLQEATQNTENMTDESGDKNSSDDQNQNVA